MKAAGEEWRTAIELAARLGRVPEATAADALRRLDDSADSEQVSTWIALPPAETEALCALARAMLGSEPTRVTPRPDSDLSTMKVDPAATVKLPPQPVAQPAAPKRLGPYELLEELGHGGMGVVYKARHAKLGNLCAVKVLLAGEFAGPEAIARFQREAAAVAKMGKHPNIVTVHDLGQEAGLAYYAMELVEGRSLRARMREGDLAPEEAVRVVEKVTRAVHFAHGHGVIHRDLKPENVMLRADGEPQVMDFGLAREVGSEERLSVAGQIMGTLAYMAPEQARGDVEAMDARTDVYALGGVLYEMLTGVPPHPGKTPAVVLPAILRGDIVAPRRLRPEIPRDLENVCVKALSLEPHRRYASAEAFADDLARFLRGEPVSARPVGRLVRAARRVRRHPLVSGLVAASAVLVAALLWRFAGPARVRMTTTPSGARVEAVGRTLWGGSWVWPAGEFTLRVSAPGYDPKELKVDLAAGATKDLGTIALDVDHGFLTVDSDPPGARVIVGERDMEVVTPVDRVAVPNGQHVLHLHLADHSDYIGSIVIEPGKDRELPRVRLQHDRGVLDVAAAPAGTTVIVLREETEVTRLSPPVEVPLDTGRYALEGHRNGCIDRRCEVEVRKDGKTSVFLPVAPNLLWSGKVADGVREAPALGDLDGDGVLDAVVAVESEVAALSGRDGRVLWARRTQGYFLGPPSLQDADADGELDAILTCTDWGITALSGRDGMTLWTLDLGGSIDTAPCIVDLDGDGRREYVVACSDRRLCACPEGGGRPSWAVETQERAQSAPAAGDANGDGTPEIVIAGRDGAVQAFDGKDGAALWSWRAGGPIQGTPALADLNGDGAADCIVGSDDHKVHAISGRDGHVLWSYETGDRVDSTASLGDLDGDGTPDCVIGAWDDCVHAVSGKDGKRLWMRRTGNAVTARAALGDMDGDGELDCVVGGEDRTLHVLSGRDGRMLWRFDAEGALGSPTLADLEGDGRLDCVVGAADGGVHALSGVGPRLRWGFSTEEYLSDEPGWMDADSDGFVDMMFTGTTAGDATPYVRLVSGRDGATIWRRQTETYFLDEPPRADLNGDGVADFVGHALHGETGAVSGRDGALLWLVRMNGTVRPVPRLADLGGDGGPDLLFTWADQEVRAISCQDGKRLWGVAAPKRLHDRPALGDVNSDGVVDCVAPSWETSIYAWSGRDGTLLWTRELPDNASAGVALADLDQDGVPEVLVRSRNRILYALSGTDGSVLWSRELPGFGAHAPVPADLNGDGRPDCLIVVEGVLYAVHGGSGCVLWSREVRDVVEGAWHTCDYDRDGAADVLVGEKGGSVHVFRGLDGAALFAWRTDVGADPDPQLVDLDGDGRGEVVVVSATGFAPTLRSRVDVVDPPVVPHPPPGDRLAEVSRLRGARAWERLERTAERTIRDVRDRWVRGVAWRDLGVARLWRGDAEGSIAAFAEARGAGVRAPDAAIYEWLASWGWAACPAERRTAAGERLDQVFMTQPDPLVDALIEARDLMSPEASAAMRKLMLPRLADEVTRPHAAVILAMPMRDGTRPMLDLEEDREAITDAYGDLAYRVFSITHQVPRWIGYNALLVDAKDEEEPFDRIYSTYLSQPRRPGALDILLAEVAERRR